ncbi:MAG TPA: DCC1-like thiol-disulfide oxidoreductase family protein [Gemmatimonadaceae bacterium]
MGERSAILLYDGTCGFCAQSVQFILAREGERRTLRFAALQSRVGAEVQRRHPKLADVDSMIWFEAAEGGRPEIIYVRSAAALRILDYLGGVWRPLSLVGGIVPRFVRDWVYDLIAKHRHKITRADPSCLLPTPEQRARFIA